MSVKGVMPFTENRNLSPAKAHHRGVVALPPSPKLSYGCGHTGTSQAQHVSSLDASSIFHCGTLKISIVLARVGCLSLIAAQRCAAIPWGLGPVFFLFSSFHSAASATRWSSDRQ